MRPRARFALGEIRRRAGVSAYRLRDTELQLHVRHGTGDAAGVDEIFLQGNYDPPQPVAALLNRLAADHPLRAADLGANIGLFSVALFALHPDASVVCFEPDAANADVLQRTRDANDRADRWQIVRAAVGAQAGSAEFLAGDFMESRVARAGEAGTVTVPVVDVFEHLADDLDWLKIDVEGGEWAILADPRFAALRIPVVALEYHPHLCPSDDPRAEIVSLLEGAGYRIEPYTERSPGLGELWAWREPAA